MLSGRMRDRLRVTRTVTDGTVDDDATSVWFPAAVGALESDGGGLPRERLRRDVVIAARVLTHPLPRLTAGARVEDRDGNVYELLDDMSEVTHAGRLVAYTAAALEVAELYPTAANILTQDGAVVSTGASVAIAASGERNTDRGTYEDFRGEAPLEHHAALNERNRSLVVGADRYRVVACVRRPSHVELDLRRAGG